MPTLIVVCVLIGDSSTDLLHSFSIGKSQPKVAEPIEVIPTSLEESDCKQPPRNDQPIEVFRLTRQNSFGVKRCVGE